ncbi:MAG TPA: hypothetical protein VML58_00630 [Burkholderiaceae bacterium]|nr:hypothetical protein [Burkholderiaceae bacterium]
MWSVSIVLPHAIRITITSRVVSWLFAGAAVLLLLGSFVTVLQQGLERGELMRAEQRRIATQPVQKPPVRTALAQPVTTKP